LISRISKAAAAAAAAARTIGVQQAAFCSMTGFRQRAGNINTLSVLQICNSREWTSHDGG